MTTPTLTSPTLVTDDLRISVVGGDEILHGVSFSLHPGRILALVGESGSGKTTAGLACLGHFRAGLENTGGRVCITREHDDVISLLDLTEAQRRRLRGGTISYVPQDPALSLNPAMRIGEQILETLRVHDFGASEAARRERATEVLAEVGLQNDAAHQRRYPHQLSGGQQQRVGIAMAFACRPAVMVLDEPTTGLDVTTQALVLQTIDELAERHQVAGLYITHDLAVVATVADEVAVMLRGDIVESGDAPTVLFDPQHPYTRKLLAAVPDLAGKRRVGRVEAITGEVSAVTGSTPVQVKTEIEDADATPTVSERVNAAARVYGPVGVDVPSPHSAGTAPVAVDEDAPVISVRSLRQAYGSTVVLDGIDLDLARGESLMLLGESGSGKTTLSRCIAGLNAGYTGSVTLDGDELAPGTRDRSTAQRQSIQYVFQSPFSSLNPRRTIGESIEVPMRMSGILTKKQRRATVLEALDHVRLGSAYVDRRPGDLSGGERQRAAIARALVNAPSVLVCDEMTSALDVSVQASILDLLRTLQLETGMSMLFVTHNIALARHISQRLAVLQKGSIVDLGLTDDVLENPQHAYTKELLANVPTFEEQR
ncbi:dipeptide ABC transporter ATP-binding protein [Paramicrobacterium chengjingii]|uniref:dipeptide ABC transporter ATP-binding protein n=1 Tax=Paramicrobacterium chengjingii TaxID=2769067 RepID=UPI0014210EDC|nr:ABC transporter ATP-binding protein [Microbacterium chengjingii]